VPPSAMAIMRRYIRDRHRSWWKGRAGRMVQGGPIRSWAMPPGVATAVHAGAGDLLLPAYDWWSPRRWEPTGTHPKDVRPAPSRYLGYVTPTDELETWEFSGYRPGAQQHARAQRECRPCAALEALILGPDDLSLEQRSPVERKQGAERRCHTERLQRHFNRVERGAPSGDRGDKLGEREQSYYWWLRSQAGRCSTATAVLQRTAISAGSTIERVAVPLRCRTRECMPCAKEAGKRAVRRMEHDWTQLVTMTLRQDRCSEGHAWRNVSKWVSRLMSRLQDIAKKDRGWCGCVTNPDRKPHWNVKMEGRKLNYCWAIEPHKLGWPHVHIAWDADYVCFDLVREIWWEVTGIDHSGSFVVKVEDPKRIPNYLAFYLTKTRFSTYYLALMGRRRTWATTIKKKREEESGYALVEILTGEAASEALACKRPPLVRKERFWAGEEHHWKLESGKEWKWSKWTISGQISDIALSGAKDEAEKNRQESQEGDDSADRRRARHRQRRVIAVKKDKEGLFIDVPIVAMLAWRARLERKDRSGGAIRKGKQEASTDRSVVPVERWLETALGSGGESETIRFAKWVDRSTQ